MNVKMDATINAKNKERPPRVCIIMVTFNRSDVTNLALDSIVKAQTSVPFELIVIDNASAADEIYKIEQVFNFVQKKYQLQGQLIKSATNLGFAGGNNIGLRLAFAREAVDETNDSKQKFSHICLLNNDVIVTDHWLERLVEMADDALVGPVSNSVGNEQIVKVDYRHDQVNGYTRDAVRAFASTWEKDHLGNVVPTSMLGFFCVLGPIELFTKVGLLDEIFGRGYYEDDDYCLRIKQNGFDLKINRGVFIHHWGSASFSQIGKPELSSLFQINRKLFEEKHGVVWSAYEGTLTKALLHEVNWLHSRGRPLDEVVAEIEPWIKQWWQRSTSSSPLENRIEDFIKRLFWTPSLTHRCVRFGYQVLVPMLKIKNRLKAKLRPIRDLMRHPEKLKIRLKSVLLGVTSPSLRPAVGKQIIFVLPIQSYFGRRQRPQHLAEGLSKIGHQVV